MAKRILCVSRTIRTVTKGGADCGVEGVAGSFSPATLAKIFMQFPGHRGVELEGLRIFDAGCGFGHIVLAAALLKAAIACGVELEKNLEAYGPIFTTARNLLGISPSVANIGFVDLDSVKTLDLYKPNFVTT